MKGLGKKLILIFVIIESLFLVLPMTLIYVYGMIALSIGTFSGHAGEIGFNSVFFILALIFLLPGYALYSLWWLILRYRKIFSFKLIPVHIYIGLVAGVFSTFILASPFNFSSSTKFITLSENIIRKIYLGLGPFIVMITLFIIIYFQRRSNNNSQQEKPTLRSGFPLL